MVFHDDHLIVVDKPSGMPCVPTKANGSSLSQTVMEAFGCESGRADKMVCHRLGRDTTGLVVLARTNVALRVLNMHFRARHVIRHHEALLCGHIETERGMIDLPLMRDLDDPSLVCVSTYEQQRELLGLDVEDVGKKLLVNPKASVTKYELMAKETWDGHPVSRVTLMSISGRTHQLNVHCAAFGHPIVGDKVYGTHGNASPFGGLVMPLSPSCICNRRQVPIAAAWSDKPMCIHANKLTFDHPVTRETMSFESLPSF